MNRKDRLVNSYLSLIAYFNYGDNGAPYSLTFLDLSLSRKGRGNMGATESPVHI